MPRQSGFASSASAWRSARSASTVASAFGRSAWIDSSRRHAVRQEPRLELAERNVQVPGSEDRRHELHLRPEAKRRLIRPPCPAGSNDWIFATSFGSDGSEAGASIAVGTTRASRVVVDARPAAARDRLARASVADFVAAASRTGSVGGGSAVAPAQPVVAQAKRWPEGARSRRGAVLGRGHAGWLISGLEWVCTLPAANNASDVLMTKTPFMMPPRPLDCLLTTPSSVPAAEGGDDHAEFGERLARLRGAAVSGRPGCGMSLLPRRVKSSTVGVGLPDGPGATGSRAASPRSRRAWRASSASKEPC